MSDEFEKALQSALRREDPGEDFSARIVERLDPLPHRVFRSRWLPAALAACVVAAVGLVQMRQHALDTARANHARAQLLQALSIASDNINIVRAAVAHAEDPNS
jgi:hypothetical protein